MHHLILWPAVLCCAFCLSAQAQICDPEAASAADADAPENAGLIAIIDPETGKLTSDPSKAPPGTLAPTPEQLARYEQAFRDAEVVVHPDGSASADVSGLPKTPLAAEVSEGEIVTCHTTEEPEDSE